ncbi:protein kinase family protein [Nonomuraea longispora]|uniref:Protein kinase family protein n=1 Tax=Nonomuraea longispora TaxID=1848320 RepID=A0A4R4NF05_9ACTN|nr:protein kinase family protein [Nonomuraea longispora]TDC07751.1 protein kinase family protein [Nonomuraea longispora]
MEETSRNTTYGAVATSLAFHGDHELGELLKEAVPLGSGVGGRSALLEVEGTPVFVKQVPLTDRELLPETVRSTANVFGLPPFCRYGIGGIGGPGGGAWRELAVHVMTTNWVLAGRFPGFPLMYHWRVLPDGPHPPPEELADVERAVAFWGGGPEVRERIEELHRSRASLVLFLEHFPHDLHEWLKAPVAAGGETAGSACELVERELESGVSFMNAHGLLHFDAHFQNILTDGRRLYFADFGLSISSRFTMSSEESDFFRRHATYDRAYTRTHLVNWLAAELYGAATADERGVLMRRWADGERPEGVPETVAAILTRHSPVAIVMSGFYRRFQRESRLVPYPLEEILAL